MNENMGTALDWDSPIEKESPEFVLLPEGEYPFTVTTFERARHAGSTKLPPCPKAVLHIKIDAPEGSTTILHNLFLHQKTEGMLCSFFTAIGQRQSGEKIKPDWNAVPGATGKAKIGVREWTKENGEKGYSNEVKRFLEPAKFEPGRF